MKENQLFDRSKMIYAPLSERKNKVSIEESCVGTDELLDIPRSLSERIGMIAEEIIRARALGASVICAFGAHTIKNGLGRVLGAFAEQGWFTHLATNGAGVIHDWEFAYQGKSSEDVRENVQEGRFGTWQETGLYINLALAVGSYEGLGYGESIGSLITGDGLHIPEREELYDMIMPAAELFEHDRADVSSRSDLLYKRAAAADLLELIQTLDIPSGFFPVMHEFRSYSVQALAFESQIPFTSHPMFGHDIIYTHKANRGAAVGRTAERDFLSYVRSVSNLEGGVYLSVGSAVMSPMIFEKSLSMARNVLLQQDEDIRDCGIHVVDLQEETWDWSRGEPPADNPAYYLRFMKTFNRMGCRVDYTSADNRLFLVGLYQELIRRSRR